MSGLFPTFRKLWPRRATLPQRLALLRLIAVATEERLALAPLLEAWAADQSGAQRDRVFRLAHFLKSGTPLPDAVEQVPRLLRDEDVLAIRFGAQSGILAASVRQSIDELNAELDDRRPTVRGAFAYAGVLALVFFAISLFYYIKIVPAINNILADYDIERPPALAWNIEFADVVSSYWWLAALLLAALAWLFFSAKRGRAVREALFGRVFRAWRQLRWADVLEKLSLASAAGRPMPGALSTLARYHFDPRIRRELLFARNEVEQGADVWPTLAAAGLLSPAEERLLDVSERVGNRSWALDKLAANKKRRVRRRLRVWSALTLPIIALVFGGYVLAQALSLFVPLVEFIFHHL
jgi:type II secretory pathway component PulF